MTDAGTVVAEQADGTRLEYSPATARPAAVNAADRVLYRAPYGFAPKLDGDDLRGVERLEVAIEVWDADGIEAAQAAVTNLVFAFRNAALIDTPLGGFIPRGVESIVTTPIELGYRVELVIITDGWAGAAEEGVLRLIGGPVWGLR